MNVIAPIALLALALMSACQGDESVSAYAPYDRYALVEVDGLPFSAGATLNLATTGRVSGTAPCNTWAADQTAPYPWFETGPIAATRMACPDLEAEAAFFAALETMTLAEAVGATLILSNTDGREMVFQALR